MSRRFIQIVAVSAACTLGLTACGGGQVVVPEAAGAWQQGRQYRCPQGRLIGGGATSQKIAIDTLASDYSAGCGGRATIEYSGTGSGQGIKDFYNNQIDWAGSDAPLRRHGGKDSIVETDRAAARCGGNPAWHLPLVISPVAFAHNVTGVDDLVLSPALISDISFGRITRWNDPRVAALNPGAELPDLAISVFFRSDDSGTTEAMTNFLKAAAQDSFPAEPAKKWPGSAGEGRKGSQGVADGVASTKGGFGYMEWKFAKDNRLGVASLDNGAGPVVLTAESAALGAAEATQVGTGHDVQLTLNYHPARSDAYPALMVTYEVACSAGLDGTRTALLKDFLSYAVTDEAQATLVEEGHGPLPDALRVKVSDAIEAIR